MKQSKAEKWADRFRRPEFHRKSIWDGSPTPMAYVTKWGTLFIKRSVLEKGAALEFAHWIQDTFGVNTDE